MQVGIVGAGGIFQAHAEAYSALGVQISAVVDVDRAKAERAATQFRIPLVATDWRELMDRQDITIIDVCTPPRFHKPVVLAALHAGKHVVCEKPLAISLFDCDEITRVAEASAGKFTTVHQLRYHPGYMRLKRLIDGGYLGRVCFARQVHYSPPPRHLIDNGLWGDWELTGGGVVMTKAVHHLDLLLWLFGSARRVQATLGTYLYPIQSEDHAAITIEFEQGTLVSLCLSGCAYGLKDELEVVGDQGIAAFPWEFRLTDGAAQARAKADLDAIYPAPSGFQRKLREAAVRLRLAHWRAETQVDHLPFLRAFFQAVKDNGTVPVSAREGRNAVELCTAIYTAALTKKTVELPLDSSSRCYEGVRKDDYSCAR
jgi:UDP-N-acetyl-2-amino-2-deoxyglucuronate dehydrogenase